MTFRSLYAHGFARVAACTADVWIADPSRNAAGIAAVAAASSPNATCTASSNACCPSRSSMA